MELLLQLLLALGQLLGHVLVCLLLQHFLNICLQVGHFRVRASLPLLLLQLLLLELFLQFLFGCSEPFDTLVRLNKFQLSSLLRCEQGQFQ